MCLHTMHTRLRWWKYTIPRCG